MSNPPPLKPEHAAMPFTQPERREAKQEEVPLLTDALDDEDIPLLIDVASETPLRPPPAKVAQVAPPPAKAANTRAEDLLLAELAQRLEKRLAKELPNLIYATLREYLAEKAQARQRHD